MKLKSNKQLVEATLDEIESTAGVSSIGNGYIDRYESSKTLNKLVDDITSEVELSTIIKTLDYIIFLHDNGLEKFTKGFIERTRLTLETHRKVYNAKYGRI